MLVQRRNDSVSPRPLSLSGENPVLVWTAIVKNTLIVSELSSKEISGILFKPHPGFMPSVIYRQAQVSVKLIRATQRKRLACDQGNSEVMLGNRPIIGSSDPVSFPKTQ